MRGGGWIVRSSIAILVLLHLGAADAKTGRAMEPVCESPDRAGAGGDAILWAGRRMIEAGTIIRGSCYKFVNAVFERAGYPGFKRHKVFESNRAGPFADVDLLRPGDWVMHRNREYHGIEHSGIFVCWDDRSRRRAWMLSYVGERRLVPGNYRIQDLSEIYRIIRAAGPAAQR